MTNPLRCAVRAHAKRQPGGFDNGERQERSLLVLVTNGKDDVDRLEHSQCATLFRRSMPGGDRRTGARHLLRENQGIDLLDFVCKSERLRS